VPDLRGLAATQRRMARLERAYERWLKERAGGLRESLAAWTLDAWGRPGLEVAWRSELNRLADDEWKERQTWLKGAWNLGALHVADQTRILRPMVPYEVPSARALRLVVEVAWEGAPKPRWVDALHANLAVEYLRLRQSGEDPERAVRRLFGVNKPDGRASVWELGLLKASLEFVLVLWGALNAAVHVGLVRLEERVPGLRRQAIAAIDERTTDCCLRVHGQIVGVREPFRLHGTPRFADEMMDPPFHWHCRTVVTLYHPSMEEVGVSTREMREAARAELEARQRTGRREVIHPAHATSRRKR